MILFPNARVKSNLMLLGLPKNFFCAKRIKRYSREHTELTKLPFWKRIDGWTILLRGYETQLVGRASTNSLMNSWETITLNLLRTLLTYDNSITRSTNWYFCLNFATMDCTVNRTKLKTLIAVQMKIGVTCKNLIPCNTSLGLTTYHHAFLNHVQRSFQLQWPIR